MIKQKKDWLYSTLMEEGSINTSEQGVDVMQGRYSNNGVKNENFDG